MILSTDFVHLPEMRGAFWNNEVSALFLIVA